MDHPPHPVAAWLAGGLIWLLNRLPAKGRGALAAALGGLVYALGIRRRVTLDNLEHAFPEKSLGERRRIARGAYRNMALAVLESLAWERISREPLSEPLFPDNWELLEGHLRAGRGAFMATAHFGNWELFGAILARRGIPMHVVVRPLKGAINARIVEARLATGAKLIPPKGAVTAISESIRKGALVMVLIDQVIAARHGVFVPFFGRPASTAPALALAAYKTEAPVFVLLAAREGGRLRVFLEGPFTPPRTGSLRADLTAHTATLTAVLERYIRRYPDQWLWLHRRWKVRPSEAQAQPEP